MPTRDRVRDRGVRRSRRLLASLSTELREARLSAGVSQDRVARISGISQSSISRTERAIRRAITIEEAALHAEAVGLRLSVKAYPTGIRVRDTAQLRLFGRLRDQVHERYRWRTEVPVAGRADLRAWDAALDGPSLLGIEAESRLRDVQATQRRIELKLRDGPVELAILLVAATVHNRRVLRAYREALRSTFPADSGEILRALRSRLPIQSPG